MKSDSSFLLYANYNEFFVLSDFFPDPTVYIGHSLLSFVYKFKGYDLRNVQMYDFRRRKSQASPLPQFFA